MLKTTTHHQQPVEELQIVQEIPSSVDWRMEGAVTPVKDQGSCGACWAFSATGAIEGINSIFNGSLVSLSEQEFIDCDTSYNSGCEGGLMDYAFEFVIKNHGIDTQEDYPFRGRKGSCNKEKLEMRAVTIDGYVELIPNNERRLLIAVAIQPVSVGLCGSNRAFQLYSKGIFTGPCSTSLDHAALIVGYGSENEVDYWIVKNSWGTQWGMDGYIYMLRNSGEPEGVCGIDMLASYPIKSSTIPHPPDGTRCSLLTYCSAGKSCCLRIVIDFTASWCGPCRIIAPVFAELAKKFPQATFLKVDVDDVQAVAQEFRVEAMPTFVFFKDGKEIDRFVGADKDGLQAAVVKHSTSTASTTSTSSTAST